MVIKMLLCIVGGWMEKVTNFGRAYFSYSVVLPPLNINFPWSLGYIWKLAFGKVPYSRFCVQPTYGAQEYQTCTYTALSGYQFTLCRVKPRRLISYAQYAQRNSR